MNEIIKKNGITYGVIMGLISVLSTTIIYVTDINLFVSFWVGSIGIVLTIIIAVILLSKTRKELNNSFSFKEAFTTYFLMALISILISTAFSIILFNYIDPTLKVTINELLAEKVSLMMQKFGGKAADINKALKDIRENDQFSLISQLKGIFTSIVASSIPGLILAAIFKTKTPENL